MESENHTAAIFLIVSGGEFQTNRQNWNEPSGKWRGSGLPNRVIRGAASCAGQGRQPCPRKLMRVSTYTELLSGGKQADLWQLCCGFSFHFLKNGRGGWEHGKKELSGTMGDPEGMEYTKWTIMTGRMTRRMQSTMIRKELIGISTGIVTGVLRRAHRSLMKYESENTPVQYGACRHSCYAEHLYPCAVWWCKGWASPNGKCLRVAVGNAIDFINACTNFAEENVRNYEMIWENMLETGEKENIEKTSKISIWEEI